MSGDVDDSEQCWPGRVLRLHRHEIVQDLQDGKDRRGNLWLGERRRQPFDAALLVIEHEAGFLRVPLKVPVDYIRVMPVVSPAEVHMLLRQQHHGQQAADRQCAGGFAKSTVEHCGIICASRSWSQTRSGVRYGKRRVVLSDTSAGLKVTCTAEKELDHDSRLVAFEISIEAVTR